MKKYFEIILCLIFACFQGSANLPRNFTNQIVSQNTTVKSCDNLNVKNVTVTNGAKLALEAPGEIIITGEFEVQSGSQLEIN